MSKCDISVQLDRDPPHYRPGDTVKGKVLVLVTEPCKCTALTVELRWRTHGAGNKDEGVPDVEPFGAFEWSPGMSHEFPFQFSMPMGPVSYHGHLVNVDWYVIARADIPWAIDPRGEQDLLLLPAPALLEALDGYRRPPQHVAREHDLGAGPRESPTRHGWLFLFLLPVLVAGVIAKVVIADSEVHWTGLLVLAIFVAMAAGISWRRFRRVVAKQKVEVELSTEPSTATRGQPLGVRAALVPKRSGKLNGVRALLIGEEVAVRGSGTRRRTERHVFDEVEAEMAGSGAFRAGQRQELTATLKVPEDAAPTFRADANNVRWAVKVLVDIKDWPDLEEEIEVEIQPS